MTTSTPIPTISFINSLSQDIVIYDSFTPATETAAENNYFGRLTQLGKVAANTTGSIQPIRTTSAFIIDSVTDEKPVKRCTKMSFQKISSFTVSASDEDAMTATFKFMAFFQQNPNDPVSKSFQAILKGDPKLMYSAITSFFPKYPDYSACTFQTYMMAITYIAKIPASVPKPVQETTYSLSKLVLLLGGEWPSSLPDITVSQFTCNLTNGALDISMQIDISQLPFETPAISANINKLFGDVKLTVGLQVNLSLGVGIFGTRLTVLLDNMNIPAGSASFTIANPTVTLDINPLFMFVVFTVKGTIPFDIFNTKFTAGISMTVDNVEAAVGVVIDGDSSSLPAPPLMKGVHFDQFGVGMGIFFEPPGFALGLQGKFNIGVPGSGQNVIELDDDTFALVCKIDGEVPEPVYISFYVPEMDINQAIELFTNASPNLSVPVTLTDLSFKWAENPMEPVVLPDGTLTDMAYGFSAGINIFAFGFYGDVEIDMTNGLTANVEMSPMSLDNMFSLSGDGKGVSIKADANGNPIKNNQIRNTQALQDALKNATDKQLVSPGGPVLVINTFTSPFLHINAKVSLFELVNYGITADINKEGIAFQLDYGSILSGQMTCQLADFHNLYGQFAYGVNRALTLPSVSAMPLGSITVQAIVNAHFSINTSLSGVVLKAGGSFNFEGVTRSFGDYTIGVAVQKLTDLLEAIWEYLEVNAAAVFGDLVNDVQNWTNKVKGGIISGASVVSDTIRNAFNKQDPRDVVTIMKNAGYTASDVASGIRGTFALDANGVASAMKDIFEINDIANALNGVFGLGADAVSSVLQNAGYQASQVADAFKSLGGTFADFAKQTWDKLNPFNW